MSESAKFNSLLTGSIFLVSKLNRNMTGTFKSHATAKSGSFVWFCFVCRFFVLGGGGGGGGGGERHLARITLSSKRKQYICNYCDVFSANYSLRLKIL